MTHFASECIYIVHLRVVLEQIFFSYLFVWFLVIETNRISGFGGGICLLILFLFLFISLLVSTSTKASFFVFFFALLGNVWSDVICPDTLYLFITTGAVVPLSVWGITGYAVILCIIPLTAWCRWQGRGGCMYSPPCCSLFRFSVRCSTCYSLVGRCLGFFAVPYRYRR